MNRRKYHPAPRPPRRTPPRVELNVLKLDEDGNSIYDDDLEEHVCNCYPTTSSKLIPSMLYDNLRCPHVHTNHVIQPGQRHVFAYPWTANTNFGGTPVQRSYDRNQLSAIKEEDELFPSRRQPPDSIRTAPPFADLVQNQTFRSNPPFSAPVDSEWPDNVDSFRRYQSVPSLTGYMSPRSQGQRSHVAQPQKYYRPTTYEGKDEFIEPSTPYLTYNRKETRDRLPTQRPPRNFEGSYVDPKTKQVYKFKVKYGKKNVEAERTPDQTNSYRATPNVR